MGKQQITELKRRLPALTDLITDKIDRGNEYASPCPECGGEDRFFWTKGAASGHCRQCGKNFDNLDIVMTRSGKTIPELLQEYGIEVGKKRRAGNWIKRSRVEYIWSKAKKSPDDIARYMQVRGIDPEPVKGLPALRVSKYTDNEGQQVVRIIGVMAKPGDKRIKAVQRLWLDPETYKKKAAKILGEPKGRGCWFRRGFEQAETVLVGEGIETTLAAYAAIKKDNPEIEIHPVAAISSSLLKLLEFPETAKKLYILVDEDENLDTKTMAGQRAAYQTAKQFIESIPGREAFLVTPTEQTFSDSPNQIDFNDLQEDEIIDRWNKAVKFEDLKWTPEDQKKAHIDTEIKESRLPRKTIKQLNKLNERYAAALVGGKFRVIREGYDEIAKRNKVDFLTIDAFRLYHKNKKVVVPDGEDAYKMIELASAWLSWEDRRTYHSITFRPYRYGQDKDNKSDSGVYNLFAGWPVEPKKGSWNLMRQHILDVLCQGNEQHFTYLLDWMARILQDPAGNRPGVAIVMQGGKGVGKGVFAQYFGRLFGDAFLPISDSSGFTGRFNMHLSKTVLVFLDEATWGGNKQEEGRLKAIITEPAMMFEPKGIDSIALQNHMNVLIASNEDWVVPATGDERRFFVLNPSDHRAGDRKYFSALFAELEGGGPAAMMYDLLRREITVDLRNAPKTDGLRNQIVESLPPVLRFWGDILYRGYLLSDVDGSPTSTVHTMGLGEKWPSVCYRHEVYNEFLNFCRSRGVRHIESEVWFWRRTFEFWGETPKRIKAQRIGEHGKWGYPIELPPLDELRQMFSDVHLAGRGFSEEQEDEGGYTPFDGQF